MTYNPVKNRIRRMPFFLMLVSFLVTVATSVSIIAVKERAKAEKTETRLAETIQ